MAKPGKGVDLAVVFGGPMKGKSSAPVEDDEDAAMDEESDEVPPEFEAAVLEAFPDMDGDMARMAALKRAIKACY